MEQADREKRKQARRRKRRLQKLILKAGMMLCAAAFLIGAFIAGKALLEDREAKASYGSIREQMQKAALENSTSDEALNVQTGDTDIVNDPKSGMDFSALKSINNDIVGWLTADGTVIDYPVLHADDNDYYLAHLYNKEKNRAGSLFVDYRNTGFFTDRNTVIYGHNMKSGAMFNTLSEYKQQDYYDAIPVMKLYTPNGDYCIELFCGTVEDGNYEFVQFEFKSDQAFMEYIESFRARSTFTSDVEISPDDRIVSLCTCSYEKNNARYMLMGRLTEMN